MGSIAIIVRAEAGLEELGENWVPLPLGERHSIESIVKDVISTESDQLLLSLEIEGPDESDLPRSITASGVWGAEERRVLRSLCQRLSARLYDAESGGFIEHEL